MRRFKGMIMVGAACLGLLLLAGCGASPEGVAEEFVKRFAEREFTDLDKYVVPEQREDFRRELDDFAQALAEPDEASTFIMSAMELDLKSVDGEIINESAETARVRLTLDALADSPKDKAFLASDNMGVTVTKVRLEGTLDFMLAKVKGQWRIDLEKSADLWEDGFETW